MPSRQASNSRRGPNPRIGGPLRALLDERFIAHAELAQHLGVHEQNVSRWVRNETGPTKRNIRAIAAFFDVEPASLVEPSLVEPDDEEPVAA